MNDLKTCPAIVPPPPIPPTRTAVAAASPEPSRRPATISNNFLQNVLSELKRVVWPHRGEVYAASCVTVGLLAFFSLYLCSLNWATTTVFRAIGLLS